MPIESPRRRDRRASVRRRQGLTVGVITTIATAATALLMVLVSTASADVVATEDFEDGVATDWTTSGGQWSVVRAAIGTDRTTMVYRQAAAGRDARARWAATGADHTIEAGVQPVAFNGADRFVAILSRMQSATGSYYYLSLRSSGRLELRKLVAGTATTLASAPYPVAAGTWYTLRLTAVGSTLRGTVSSGAGPGPVVVATDSSYSSGNVGLATHYASAVFDDVRLTHSSVGSTSGPCRTFTMSPPPGWPGSVPPTGQICPTRPPLTTPVPPPVTTPAAPPMTTPGPPIG